MIDNSVHTPPMASTNLGSPTSRPFWRPVGHWLAWIELAWQISRERRSLANLSAQQLSDVGITAADVADEVARPWWQIPRNRLRGSW